MLNKKIKPFIDLSQFPVEEEYTVEEFSAKHKPNKSSMSNVAIANAFQNDVARVEISPP